MSGSEPIPSKKDVTEALLTQGTAFIHLDPRDSTVHVPTWLKEQPQLVLQVGLDMPIPIPDLRIDEDGVYGTLSFKGQPFTCVVPWERVFAIVGDDGRGMVWAESMPGEIAAEVAREADRHRPADASKRADGIKAVADVSDSSDAEADAEADAAGELQEAGTAPDADAAPTGSPQVTAIDGAGRRSSPPAARRAPSGKLQLPPYMRVVK